MEMNGGSSASHLARTPYVPLFCASLLLRMETEGVLDYEGRPGIMSIVRWNLRPVIFGVDESPPPRNPKYPLKREFYGQDKFDHDKGQKSAISGRRLHWRLSTGLFVLLLEFLCAI